MAYILTIPIPDPVVQDMIDAFCSTFNYRESIANPQYDPNSIYLRPTISNPDYDINKPDSTIFIANPQYDADHITGKTTIPNPVDKETFTQDTIGFYIMDVVKGYIVREAEKTARETATASMNELSTKVVTWFDEFKKTGQEPTF